MGEILKISRISEERRMVVILKLLYLWPLIIGTICFLAFYDHSFLFVIVVLSLITLIQAYTFFQSGRLHDYLPATLSVIYVLVNFIPHSSVLHPLGWFFFFHFRVGSYGEFFGYSIDTNAWPITLAIVTTVFIGAFWIGWWMGPKKVKCDALKTAQED